MILPKPYQFIKKLMQLGFVEKLVLFGSRARGNYKEKSDIDLALFCPHASIKDWQIIVDVIDDADTLLKIDCVRYDKLIDDSKLKKNIDKYGITLFAR